MYIKSAQCMYHRQCIYQKHITLHDWFIASAVFMNKLLHIVMNSISNFVFKKYTGMSEIILLKPRKRKNGEKTFTEKNLHYTIVTGILLSLNSLFSR